MEQLVTEALTAETIGSTLDVSSPAFEDGASIPDTYAAEGDNVSPSLSWESGPSDTRSYALIVEDPDAPKERPFVHWIVYNLLPDVTQLNEGVPGAPRLQKPEGALQGTNDRGSIGYFGPRPPVGDPPHHYHFQVLALDTVLDLPHGASRSEFLDAIQGHIIASGELVGTYERRQAE